MVHTQDDNDAIFVVWLEAAYERLWKEHPDSSKPEAIQNGWGEFIGVRMGLKGVIDAGLVRSAIEESLLRLEPSESYHILQVVGDSGGAFTPEAYRRAYEILRKNINNRTIIEYGFTASDSDANWLVNDYLHVNPLLDPKVIGNVVYSSAEAVGQWHCRASPSVHTFVLAYNEDGSPTKFGDDAWLSDGIMSGARKDRMICFEGGAQTFTQAVNVLKSGVKVIAVIGLRDLMKTGMFSAAELLLTLQRSRSQGIPSLELEFEMYMCDHYTSSDKQEERIKEAFESLLGTPHLENVLTQIVTPDEER